MPVNPVSDAQIMLQVRDGEIGMLGTLFQRHNVALFNYFLRLSAKRAFSEDMVQEVFLRVLKYRQTYRGESEFKVWLFRIARNAWIDHLRKKRFVRFSLDENNLPEPVSNDPLPQQVLEEEQRRNLLKQALGQLTPDKREVLVLSRYQDMRYEEIAQVLDCTVSTVKVKVHRALKELRVIVKQMTGEVEFTG